MPTSIRAMAVLCSTVLLSVLCGCAANDVAAPDLSGSSEYVADTDLGSRGKPTPPPPQPTPCRIAYLNGNVFSMYTNGTGGLQLTSIGDNARATRPDWSPDGQYIAFGLVDGLVEPTIASGIRRINAADGSNPVWITGGSPTSPTDDWVQWSPDGSWIAFSRIDLGNYKLCIVDPNVGESSVRLLWDYNPHCDDISPTWSPRGDMIAFVTMETQSVDYDALWVIDVGPDGAPVGEPRMLVDNEIGIGYIKSVDWSPVEDADGNSRIAYDRVSPNYDIYVATVDRSGALVGGPVNVTAGIADKCGFPSWSPDGSEFAFGAQTKKSWQIRRMKWDGTGMTTVGPGSTPSWSPVLQ